jgi:7,8-dihydro-6-hydroxymethylpterin-pyrophosphokinase
LLRCTESSAGNGAGDREAHRNDRDADLDLLLYGRRRVRQHGLALPHPFDNERAFRAGRWPTSALP